jgi:endonuclease YncB( thermonuclease family)
MKAFLWVALPFGLAMSLATCAPIGRVADGDTIVAGVSHYRLWAIEAPELRQVCADGWPAGLEARRALEALIKDRRVVCEPRGRDPYRRALALCRVDGQDVGAAMVAAGMAWASSPRDYLGVEQDARDKALGVHAHACTR